MYKGKSTEKWKKILFVAKVLALENYMLAIYLSVYR